MVGFDGVQPLGALRVRMMIRSHRCGLLPALFLVERREATRKGKPYWNKVAAFPSRALAARHVAKIMSARLVVERARAA